MGGEGHAHDIKWTIGLGVRLILCVSFLSFVCLALLAIIPGITDTGRFSIEVDIHCIGVSWEVAFSAEHTRSDMIVFVL